MTDVEERAAAAMLMDLIGGLYQGISVKGLAILPSLSGCQSRDFCV